MDVFAHTVESGRFFAVADNPPNNVYIMRIQPRRIMSKIGTNNWDETDGLCQNIHDESFWSIRANRFVRLIREDEYDKTKFYV